MRRRLRHTLVDLLFVAAIGGVLTVTGIGMLTACTDADDITPVAQKFAADYLPGSTSARCIGDKIADGWWACNVLFTDGRLMTIQCGEDGCTLPTGHEKSDTTVIYMPQVH